MACGKNGATCWLAGAVRTLQKRVEWLEARAQHASGPAPVWGHSGGARWQNCPWCPKPATVVGVDVSDEEKYFISMTRLEEESYAA